MLAALVAAAVVGSGVAPVAPSPAGSLAWFSGAGRCAGRFANGAPLASTIGFEWLAPATALIKHHDDVASGVYHAVELWTFEKPAGLHGLIADGFSVGRQVVSLGWEGDVLTWVYVKDATRTERFVYTWLAPNQLRVDWQVSTLQVPFHLDDTLTSDR